MSITECLLKANEIINAHLSECYRNLRSVHHPLPYPSNKSIGLNSDVCNVLRQCFVYKIEFEDTYNVESDKDLKNIDEFLIQVHKSAMEMECDRNWKRDVKPLLDKWRLIAQEKWEYQKNYKADYWKMYEIDAKAREEAKENAKISITQNNAPSVSVNNPIDGEIE